MKEFVAISAFVVLMLALGFLPPCEPDRGEATRTLRGLGMRDISFTQGSRFWSGCGADDGANVRFSAVGASGDRVAGILCCGGPFSFKNCTVRFE